MRIPSARLKASSLSPRSLVRLASSSSSSSTGRLSISSSPHSRGRSYSHLDGSPSDTAPTSSETDPPRGWWTLARSPPPSTSTSTSTSSSHLPLRSSSSSSTASPTFLGDYPLYTKPSPPPSLRYLPRIRPKPEMNNHSKISLLPRLFPAGVPVPLPSSSSSSLGAISLLPPQPLLLPRYDPQHYGYRAPKFLLSHKPPSSSSSSSSPSSSSSSSRSHPSPLRPPPPHLAHLPKPRPSSDLPPRSPPFSSFSSFYATRPGPLRNPRPHLLDAPPPPAPPKQTPPLLLTPPTPPPPLFISPLTKSTPPPPSFLKMQLGRQSEGIKRKTRLSRRLSSPTPPPPPPTLPSFLTLPSVEDRLLRALEGKKEKNKKRNLKKRERRRKVEDAVDVEGKFRSTKQQVSKPPTFLLQAIKLEGSREEKEPAIKRKKTVAKVEVSEVVEGVKKLVNRQQSDDERSRERRKVAPGLTSKVLTEKLKVVLSGEDDAASTLTSPLLAETLRAIAPFLDQHLDVLKSIKLELQAQRCREPSPPSTTSELGSPPSQSSSLLAQFSVFGGGKKKSAEEEEVRRIMWKQTQEVGELRKALRQLQDPNLQTDPAASSPSDLGSTWTAQRLRRPRIPSETTSSITHASFRSGDFKSSSRSGSVHASPFAAAPFQSSFESAPFPHPPNESRLVNNLKSLFKAARSSSDFEVALKVLGSSNPSSDHRDQSDFAAFVNASIRLSLVPRAMEVLADPSSGAKAWIHRNSEILPFKLRQMLIALVPESSPSSVSNQDASSSSTLSLPYTASDLNAFNQHTSTLLPAPDFLILAISLRAYYLLGPSGNEGLQAVSSLVLAYQDTFAKPTSKSKSRIEEGMRVTRDLDSIRPFIDPEVMAAFDETQAPSTSFHRGRLLGIVERVARDLPIGKAIRDLHLPASAIGGIPPDLPPFPKLIEAYLRPSLLARPDDWFITLLSLYLRRLVGGPNSPVFLEAVENLGVEGGAERWTRGSESALAGVAKMALREIGGDLKDAWGVEKKSLWDDVLGEEEGWTVRMEKERMRKMERDRLGMKSKGSGEVKAGRKKVLGFFER